MLGAADVNSSVEPFPFGELVHDTQTVVAREHLDPATRCSLALTCRDFYRRYFDSNMFGVNLALVSLDCGHAPLMRYCLDKLQVPFDAYTYLVYLKDHPQNISWDLLEVLLPRIDQKLAESRDDDFPLFEVLRVAFTKIRQSVADADLFQRIASNGFWRGFGYNVHKEKILGAMIRAGPYEFFEYLVNQARAERQRREGNHKSRSQAWLKKDDLTDYYFVGNSIALNDLEVVKKFYRLIHPEETSDELIEKALFSFFYCNAGIIIPFETIVQFTVDYYLKHKSNPAIFTKKLAYHEHNWYAILNGVAKAYDTGAYSAVQLFKKHSKSIFKSDLRWKDAHGNALRTAIATGNIPLFVHLKENVIKPDLFSDWLFSLSSFVYDVNLEISRSHHKSFAEFFSFIALRFPDLRDLLLQCQDNKCTVSPIAPCATVELLELLLSQGLEFEEDVLDRMLKQILRYSSSLRRPPAVQLDVLRYLYSLGFRVIDPVAISRNVVGKVHPTGFPSMCIYHLSNDPNFDASFDFYLQLFGPVCLKELYHTFMSERFLLSTIVAIADRCATHTVKLKQALENLKKLIHFSEFKGGKSLEPAVRKGMKRVLNRELEQTLTAFFAEVSGAL